LKSVACSVFAGVAEFCGIAPFAFAVAPPAAVACVTSMGVIAVSCVKDCF